MIMAMRLPPGYGSVTKLSGNRRRPFMVKVNSSLDERGYPKFDILGYYENRADALQALADYNRNPYDLKSSKATFQDVYEMWFKWKYETSKKKYSRSSISCTVGAFKKCAALHGRILNELKTSDLQAILDDFTLSHAYMEHIKNLFNQMYKYAMEYDIVQKDYSQYVRINKADDDEHGVPFTLEDIEKLWQYKDDEAVATVLIFIYSGWRISELLGIKREDVDMENLTFTGGVKTKAGKNRVVPIHSAIVPLVKHWYDKNGSYLICTQTRKKMPITTYRGMFADALKQAGITNPHTPHDCRHTFTSLLDTADVKPLLIKLLVGHASQDLTERVYTHKTIDELRNAIEMIKIN